RRRELGPHHLPGQAHDRRRHRLRAAGALGDPRERDGAREAVRRAHALSAAARQRARSRGIRLAEEAGDREGEGGRGKSARRRRAGAAAAVGNRAGAARHGRRQGRRGGEEPREKDRRGGSAGGVERHRQDHEFPLELRSFGGSLRMRPRPVAGNWNMNGGLRANAALLDSLKGRAKPPDGVERAVCVPFPYLPQVSAALAGSTIAWGAQDVSEHDAGAYTGEVSGAMLREFGCRYAIVGHSERRALYGDDDKCVAAKFKAAQRAGLTPILCVGETLQERERGETERVVGRQLDAVIGAARAFAGVVLAYEPVWAIGTGKNATPQQAQEVHAFLRGRLTGEVTILYGGSVKPGNAKELFAMPDIDGGLIGGASLAAAGFIAICAAARP